ncbi:MAG TPA: oxidoreductase, partial [Agromyces sp.]|nr:oxidoreductase [Agromyces sp.]
MPETTGRARRWVLPAAAGVASVAFGAGVGELAAAVLAPASSPFVVVGAMLIDLAPPWAKDAAIALFGTADKAALLIGIGLVLLALASAAGVLEARRPPLGRVLIGIFGVVGAVAASTRANASMLSAAPSAIAAIAGVLALQFLVRRLPATEQAGAAVTDAAATAAPDASQRNIFATRDAGSSASPESSADSHAETPVNAVPHGVVDRRRFLGWAGGAAALGVLAALGGYALQAGSRA